MAFRTGEVIGGSLWRVDSLNSRMGAVVPGRGGIVGNSYEKGERETPRAGRTAGRPDRTRGANQVDQLSLWGRIRQSWRPRRVFSRLNTTGRAGS